MYCFFSESAHRKYNNLDPAPDKERVSEADLTVEAAPWFVW